MCEDPCNDSVTGPIVTDTTINVNNIASMINIGGEVEVYKNATVNPFELRTLKKGTEGNTVGDYGLQLVQQTSTIDIAYNPLTTNTIWVDQEFGSDNTGQLKHEKLKFQTIGAAVAAATTGYTIVIAPGTYTETEPLSKTGITLAGSPNVIIYSTNSFINDVTNFNIVGKLTIIDTTSENVYLKGGFFDVDTLLFNIADPSVVINIKGDNSINDIIAGVLQANYFVINNQSFDISIEAYIYGMYIMSNVVEYYGTNVTHGASEEGSIYNCANVLFEKSLTSEIKTIFLSGNINNVFSNGILIDSFISANSIMCQTIETVTNTTIQSLSIRIYKDNFSKGCFHYSADDFSFSNISTNYFYIDYDDSGGYSPLITTSNSNIIKGVHTIKTINFLCYTTSVPSINVKSTFDVQDLTFIIDIQKTNITSVNILNLLNFDITCLTNTSDVIFKGDFYCHESFLKIKNIKRLKLSGNINISQNISSLNAIEVATGETLAVKSIVDFENLNIVIANTNDNFSIIKLSSNDVLREYSFFNVKLIGNTVLMGNFCIGSSPAITTDISIGGTVTSNLTLPVADANFGTIVNLTSPDLDLITNSNII